MGDDAAVEICLVVPNSRMLMRKSTTPEFVLSCLKWYALSFPRFLVLIIRGQGDYLYKQDRSQITQGYTSETRRRGISHIDQKKMKRRRSNIFLIQRWVDLRGAIYDKGLAHYEMHEFHQNPRHVVYKLSERRAINIR